MKNAWMLVVVAVIMGVGQAAAHEGHSHGASTARPRAGTTPARDDPRVQNSGPVDPRLTAPAPSGPPHQGQVKAGWQHVVEVVYLPQQIRVYLYDPQGRALSPQGVAGDVVLEVNGNPRQWWYRLEPTPNGDHLVVNVDLSRVRDRDMVAIFELKNLPYREEAQVRFAQLFILSQANSRVEVVPLAAGDREAVGRQVVCPVTGDKFDHGEPIKLLVDRQPVFVCCEGCVEDVKKDPDKFASSTRVDTLRLMRQVADTPNSGKGTALPDNLVALYGVKPGVTVTQATAADASGIAQQRICPVTRQPLGAHGPPLRVTVDGQRLYVCCQGCVAEIEKDPQFFLPPPATPPTGTSSAGSCTTKGCSSCRK